MVTKGWARSGRIPWHSTFSTRNMEAAGLPGRSSNSRPISLAKQPKSSPNLAQYLAKRCLASCDWRSESTEPETCSLIGLLCSMLPGLTFLQNINLCIYFIHIYFLIVHIRCKYIQMGTKQCRKIRKQIQIRRKDCTGMPELTRRAETPFLRHFQTFSKSNFRVTRVISRVSLNFQPENLDRVRRVSR